MNPATSLIQRLALGAAILAVIVLSCWSAGPPGETELAYARSYRGNNDGR